jgi:DNA modification methylase
MSNLVSSLLSLNTAIGRWSGLGPYYAMFPKEFAFEVVEKFSKPGDLVIDPFAGRASSIYAAAAMERHGYGIEINPVGWLYGRVKLNPAQLSNVVRRIRDIEKLAQLNEQSELENLPEFFRVCYARNVLNYLITARRELRWKTKKTDATLMAIILVSLHGKREQSLSNQMRQGKAMSPEYSLRWWREKQLTPPDIDPVSFLIRRAEWRYAKGCPKLLNGLVYRGDSTSLIGRLVSKVKRCELEPFNLLFTSPPYFGITNYHYDQWLRLWMLGGTEQPSWTGEKWKGKFESKPGYRELLQTVFSGCSSMMSDDAVIYVRTDARVFTKETTIEVLKSVFPRKNMEIVPRPFKKETQTALYGDKSKKPGEVDIILRS